MMRRFTAWIAIAAMALNALWPLLANAQPGGTASPFEVCTAQGLKTIAADAGSVPDSSGQSGSEHLQPHCPLCSTGSDKYSAAPSTPLVVISAVESGCITPAAVQSAESRSDFRSPAQPRAPPAVS